MNAACTLALGIYAVLCAVAPTARCRACRGSGVTARFFACRRCDGIGRRARVGHRIAYRLIARRETARRRNRGAR